MTRASVLVVRVGIPSRDEQIPGFTAAVTCLWDIRAWGTHTNSGAVRGADRGTWDSEMHDNVSVTRLTGWLAGWRVNRASQRVEADYGQSEKTVSACGTT